MNNLHRELAPVSAGAWRQIEQEASRTLKRHLAARRVVDVIGPKGPEYAAVGTGHLHPLASPSEGVMSIGRRTARPGGCQPVDARRTRRAERNTARHPEGAGSQWPCFQEPGQRPLPVRTDMTGSRPLHGLILAGGASRRMQRDKAYIAYDGIPQLRRAYRLVAPLVGRCFISVRDSQRDDPLRSQFPLIVDRLQDCGPAAGILAAQEQDPLAGWLVVACDLPLLDEGTLAALVSSRFEEGDATAYLSDVDGQPEPLCAIWEASSHAALMACVARDNGSLRKALARSRTRLLAAGSGNVLVNTNTPDDVESILAGTSKPSP